MKSLLLAMLVGLMMVGCGEADLSDPDVVKDTTADAVDYDDLENRNWVTYLLNEETPFTGRAERFYENGQKQSKRDYKDGKLVTSVAWKPNGEKCPETNVKDGNGVEVTYYENGQKESETNYKDDKMDGLVTWWNENGQKISEWNWKDGVPHGLCTDWNENGQKKFEFTVNNKTFMRYDGPWTQWYENGQKEEEANFKDGKKDGLQTIWYRNGQKREEFTVNNGLMNFDGLRTRWYEDGQKQFEANYKDRKQDGHSINWYKNGQKEKEGNYTDGKLMSAEVWKPNGEKCPETNVKDGNGVEVRYNEDGTERWRYTYKDGEDIKAKVRGLVIPSPKKKKIEAPIVLEKKVKDNSKPWLPDFSTKR